MNVTLIYENGTRAEYSSKEEAIAQAAHDLVQPGHPAAVQLDNEDGTVLVGEEDMKTLHCQCAICNWHEMEHADRLRAENTHLHPTVPKPI